MHQLEAQDVLDDLVRAEHINEGAYLYLSKAVMRKKGRPQTPLPRGLIWAFGIFVLLYFIPIAAYFAALTTGWGSVLYWAAQDKGRRDMIMSLRDMVPPWADLPTQVPCLNGYITTSGVWCDRAQQLVDDAYRPRLGLFNRSANRDTIQRVLDLAVVRLDSAQTDAVPILLPYFMIPQDQLDPPAGHRIVHCAPTTGYWSLYPLCLEIDS